MSPSRANMDAAWKWLQSNHWVLQIEQCGKHAYADSLAQLLDNREREVVERCAGIVEEYGHPVIAEDIRATAIRGTP